MASSCLNPPVLSFWHEATSGQALFRPHLIATWSLPSVLLSQRIPQKYREAWDRSWSATDTILSFLRWLLIFWKVPQDGGWCDQVNIVLSLFYSSLVLFMPLGTTFWASSLNTSLFHAPLGIIHAESTPLDSALKQAYPSCFDSLVGI